MKKKFYLNKRYLVNAAFFLVCLIVEILVLSVSDALNFLFELCYIFALQLFAVVFYFILGASKQFIIQSDRIEYIHFFKRFSYFFDQNKFVCKVGNADVKNHGSFFGIQFLPSHSEFWIQAKTADRQAEILSSQHFEMFMARKDFQKFYDSLADTMAKNNEANNLEKLNFDR